MNNLVQFKGRCNPFNTLWTLSLELGRGYLFQTVRLDNDYIYGLTKRGNDGLKELYDSICEKILKCSNEEVEFLLNDSVFSHHDNVTNFYGIKLEQSKDSMSQRDFCALFASKEYLLRVYGKEEGSEIYKNNCRLCKLAKSVSSKEIISTCIDLLSDDADFLTYDTASKEEALKFLHSLDKKPSFYELEFMRDMIVTNFQYYSEEE